MRYLINIEYDGTDFAGWQRQKNAQNTVQEILESAFRTVLREKIILVASGRTDKGVHALAQAAHFDSVCEAKNLPSVIHHVNCLLPEAISIVKYKPVSAEFHAQYAAKKKTYRYAFYFSEALHPLRERFSFYVPLRQSINVAKMQQAAAVFEGLHDFRAFSSEARTVLTTERLIYNVKATAEGDNLYLEITGTGFLYNMVRMLAGALLEVGKGKLTVDDLKRMLDNGERGDCVFKTLPAKGLTLVNVIYE
ncbi:MAG: tRNA pseudouridine(38-40) synthase TruA [Christensenellaceae bacterium]|jgi:tRNA pseudouridine38-40 synthase|nr:tRNA pseudouridine(38-40) synthase TruA [Christensenellaceae bacterium]